MEETLLGVEGGHCWVIVVVDLVLVVERVHLVDVLLLLLLLVGRLVAVRVEHAVAGRTERQSDDTFLVGHWKNGFLVLPVLCSERNLILIRLIKILSIYPNTNFLLNI